MRSFATALLCVVCGLALSPGAAMAEPRERTPGIDFGGRLTGGLPFGTALVTRNGDGSRRSLAMQRWYEARAQFQFDLGYRIIPRLQLGSYLGLAFGAPGRDLPDCDELNRTASDAGGGELKCKALGFRIGVQSQYHFRPQAIFDPWAGLMFGYVIDSYRVSDGEDLTQFITRLSGIEATLQAGLDFRFWKLGVGPVVTASLGRFHSRHAQVAVFCDDDTCAGLGGTEDIPDGDRRWHGWLTLGVRLVH